MSLQDENLGGAIITLVRLPLRNFRAAPLQIFYLGIRAGFRYLPAPLKAISGSNKTSIPDALVSEYK